MHYSIAMELFRKLSKIFHIKFVFYMEIQYGNSIWKFNMENIQTKLHININFR